MDKSNSTRTLLVVMACLIFLTTGCQALRKPGPLENPPPVSPLRETTPGEQRITASRLMSEAHVVDGVDRPIVVVIGNDAYIGLQLEPDVNEQEIPAVERQVLRRIRAAEPRLRAVSVSADPDVVETLKLVSRRMADERPLSDYIKELRRVRNQAGATYPAT
ncbi:MAG: YhcN/YlaJ family sporulation lipoprotein [Bacillota bacterium]